MITDRPAPWIMPREERDCITRLLGSEKAQQLISDWEASEREHLEPVTDVVVPRQVHGHAVTMRDLLHSHAAGALSGPDLAALGLDTVRGLKSDRRKLDACRLLFGQLSTDPQTNKAATLGLAVLGDKGLPDTVPWNSMLDYCRRYSRPDGSLLAACETALAEPRVDSDHALFQLADKMCASIPYGEKRPMEKAYAEIRMLVAAAPMVGEMSFEGEMGEAEDFMSARLHVVDDVQSETIAKVTAMPIEKYFRQMVEIGEINRAVGSQSQQAPTISSDTETINLGGVRVRINRGRA